MKRPFSLPVKFREAFVYGAVVTRVRPLLICYSTKNLKLADKLATLPLLRPIRALLV